MEGVGSKPLNIGQYAKLVPEKNEGGVGVWTLKVASGGKPGARRRLCIR